MGVIILLSFSGSCTFPIVVAVLGILMSLPLFLYNTYSAVRDVERM